MRLVPAMSVGAAVLVCTLGAGAEPQGGVGNGHADRFAMAFECAVCHIAAPGATALKGQDGEDVSPFYTWQATLMANSFRDPYFRAQLQKETAASGEAVQELCLRCHTPLLHHEARLAGERLPRLEHAADELEADEGVSCTVCHTIAAAELGEPTTYSGLPNFDDTRTIFGPFDDVLVRPMQSQVRYTPKRGDHVRSSAMCATCHTLHTEHAGVAFPEQTPYFEWRNSEFSDERDDADPDKVRSCQQCHMPEVGRMRIARSPMGFDFRDAKPRDGVRSHAIIGGNALILDMLGKYADELFVEAEPEQVQALAAATRTQLAEQTARLSISALQREGGTLAFSIDVENLTGHKFPTGYPSRRAWLEVQVRIGDRVVFTSGAVGADGRLLGVEHELGMPHVDLVEREDQVVVYELVATDPDGAPTTFLTRMVGKQKDNRLLPRGYRADGPHFGDTAPVGVDGDEDFVGGGDRVRWRVALPDDVEGRCEVRARLLYQSVPPVWVDALRDVEAEEAQRFVAYYEAAERLHEVVATARRPE